MQTLRFNNGTCCIAFIRIGEEVADFCISDDELLLAQKISSDKRKQEFLYGRYIAKVALLQCVNSGISMRSVSILNDETRKPYVAQDLKYSVSITHSHGIVSVVAFQSSMNYGIDIEFVRTNCKHVLQRLFGDIDDIADLTKLWCIKEASYKIGISGKFDIEKNDSDFFSSYVEQLKNIIQKYSGSNDAVIETYNVANCCNGVVIQSGNIVFSIVANTVFTLAQLRNDFRSKNNRQL